MRNAPSLAVLLSAALALASPTFAQDKPAARPPAETTQPVIQVALLLDTSNSMDGLIEQAKAHLWSIVNEFATAKRGGQAPRLEVALFEYGNQGLSGETGFIRMVQPLTGDLDAVSEGLFSLTTNGGDEYCGQVIDAATKQLNWTTSGNEYRAIFIAGNEPFTQGTLSYEDACKAAIGKGIIVNTIHCGTADEGINGKWQHGAQLADGTFLIIDQNQAVAQIPAPQDDELARLNSELNTTYLWFGPAGAAAEHRQLAQDANAAALAPSAVAARTAAKSSSLYDYAQADLVDAAEKDRDFLKTLDEEALPEPLRALKPEEREKHVAEMGEKRAKLQQRVAELSKEREAYLAAERQKQAEQGTDSLGDAMLKAVREQVVEKGYEVGD